MYCRPGFGPGPIAMSSKSPDETFGTAQRASNVPFVPRAKTLPGKPLSLWVQRTPGFWRLAARPEASQISVVVTRPLVIAELNEGLCPKTVCSIDSKTNRADTTRVQRTKEPRPNGDTPEPIRNRPSLQGKDPSSPRNVGEFPLPTGGEGWGEGALFASSGLRFRCQQDFLHQLHGHLFAPPNFADLFGQNEIDLSAADLLIQMHRVKQPGELGFGQLQPGWQTGRAKDVLNAMNRIGHQADQPVRQARRGHLSNGDGFAVQQFAVAGN